MLLLAPDVTETGKLTKKLTNCSDLPNFATVFPSKVFYCTIHTRLYGRQLELSWDEGGDDKHDTFVVVVTMTEHTVRHALKAMYL